MGLRSERKGGLARHIARARPRRTWRPTQSAEVPAPAASRAHKNRKLRTLLCVLAAAAVAGCASSPPLENPLSLSPPGIPGLSTGTTAIAHQVNDLDLEAMVPPGSEWVTAGPVHGSGPAASAVSLARIRGLHGVLNAVFLCLATAGHPVTASYTWHNESGNMPCDPGPDRTNTSVVQCGSGSACVGRVVFTFQVGNSAKTIMPQIAIPRGASWEVFAWLAPPSVHPGAGVSADGTRLSRFTGYGLMFTYPQSWHSLTPTQMAGAPATTLAFESTAPLRDTCPLTSDGPGATSGGYPCGRAPVAALAPDSVLVDWSFTDPSTDGGVAYLGRPRTIAGSSGWLFSGAASANELTVGAAAGTLTLAGQQTGPTCRTLGASWVVEASLSTVTGSGYQMLACIRGPDTGQAIREVLAMVNSLQLGRSPHI